MDNVKLMKLKKKNPKRVKEAQRRFRKRREICVVLFNCHGSSYYRNTVWYKESIQRAREEFDNCLSTCE